MQNNFFYICGIKPVADFAHGVGYVSACTIGAWPVLSSSGVRWQMWALPRGQRT